MVFELPCDPQFIDPVVDLTMHMAAGMELLCGTERHRVCIAIKHALSNALYRGNLELSHAQWQEQSEQADIENEVLQKRLQQVPYRNRKIHYDARLMRDTLRITIRDEGHGFDTRTLHASQTNVHVDETKGRGLVLMHSFLDKVTFNERGNEVTLVKHCSGKK